MAEQWPKHGSYEHGVQSGASQVVGYLSDLLAKQLRFDQVCQRIQELKSAFDSGAFYSAGLNYKPATKPEEAERG